MVWMMLRCIAWAAVVGYASSNGSPLDDIVSEMLSSSMQTVRQLNALLKLILQHFSLNRLNRTTLDYGEVVEETFRLLKFRESIVRIAK